jgi:hypothetical protein
MKTGLMTLSASCIAILVTGCVERRVEYVPSYQGQPTYLGPSYSYSPQTSYQTPPAQVSAASTAAVVPQETRPPGVPPNPVVVTQAPPAPQVEVVPMVPGPEYVWLPGYWSIGVGGRWVWIGGHYAIQPRPHAVWVGGHWARRGHGYIWIGGRWR